MTNTLNAAGALLTASVEERTLTYRLLPYGEEGRTSLGRVTASQGSVTIPEDVSSVTLNLEHDYRKPVGRATQITEDESGLTATFRIARTSAGDDLLEEAAEGLRGAVSVEIDSPVIRAGRLISGLLQAAGAVVRPAFPGALLMAEDYGDLDTGTEESEEPATTSEADAEDETENTSNPESDSNMTELNAAAPAGVPLPNGASADSGLKIDSANALFAAVAKANETRDSRLFAALADITEAGIADDITVPQAVGELWSGVAYERQYVPLFNHAELTSHRVSGWRWVTKPQVAAYSGNKAEVPSNSVATEPVNIEAERIAGAHDIDRRFRDFSDTSFFESYYRAMTESYAEVSDKTVLDDVIGELTPSTLNGLAPAGTNAALAGVVQGYFQVLRETKTRPTFALVSDSLLESLVYTQESERLAYLETLLGVPVSNGFFVPSSDIPEGTVLVGTRSAVTVHELGGGAPIRVEALDVARGGIDAGVFGYLAVNVHDTRGLALIDTAGV